MHKTAVHLMLGLVLVLWGCSSDEATPPGTTGAGGGLYSDELHAVSVCLIWAGWAYGYCWDAGEVDIPAVSISRLGEIIGRPRLPLTDIVRHEFAHALAAVHPGVVDGPRFERVLGARYSDEWAKPAEFDPQFLVTPYATTSPAENFAETVMVYTRHRVRLERYARREGVMEGFEFVQWVAGDLPQTGQAVTWWAESSFARPQCASVRRHCTSESVLRGDGRPAPARRHAQRR